jgi:hypothetical protein
MKLDNSILFFENLKSITEAKWEHIDPNDPFAPLLQPGSKWKPGLSDELLHAFEKEMGFKFPEPLRNFYRTMNGVDRPYIYIDENNNSTEYNQFYSYPDHLELIRSGIKWIYESNHVTPDVLTIRGISRIFPIWSHRFIMIDKPGHPILSMHDNDIIFFAFTLAAACRIDVLDIQGRRQYNQPVVPFWYPGWHKYPKMPKYKRDRGVMTKWIRKMKKQVVMQYRAMG